MKTKIFLTTLALAANLSSTPTSGAVQIKLNFPRQNQPVGWRSCFTGIVSDPGAHVTLVLRPTESSSYYVQPKVEVFPDGTFSVVAYVAEPGGRFVGKHFVARAFANPSTDLSEADELDDWPQSQSGSNPVEVTRSGDDLTDCPRDSAAITQTHVSVGAAKPTAIRIASFPKSAGSPDSVSGKLYTSRMWRWLGSALLVFLILCYIALVTVPSKAEEALKTVTDWHRDCWKWRNSRSPSGGVSPIPDGVSEAQRVWRARSSRPNFTSFVHHFLMAPIFAVCFTFCFFTDAVNLAPGLKATMPPPENATQPLVDFDGMRPAQAERVSLIGTEGLQKPNSVAWPVAGFLAAPVRRVWAEQPLALALAVIQAALGCALFRGLSTEKVLGGSVRVLFGERPILTSVFCLLTVSLGVVAGNRGYEFSMAGMHWQIPALVAALIGVTFPAAMAYTLHFTAESAVEVLAAISAGAGAIGAVTVVTGIPVLWVWTIRWSGQTLITLPALASSLLYAVVGGLLWSALLLNAFFGKWGK